MQVPIESWVKFENIAFSRQGMLLAVKRLKRVLGSCSRQRECALPIGGALNSVTLNGIDLSRLGIHVYEAAEDVNSQVRPPLQAPHGSKGFNGN